MMAILPLKISKTKFLCKNLFQFLAIFVFASGCNNLPVSKKDQYAFFGKWDCEVGIFTFDANGYRLGESSRLLVYKSIEELPPDGFGLTFTDDYRIGLFDVTPHSMIWSSPASGSIFQCLKIAFVSNGKTQEYEVSFSATVV